MKAAAIGNSVIYKLGFDGAACERLQALSDVELDVLVTELKRVRAARVAAAVAREPLPLQGVIDEIGKAVKKGKGSDE